MQAWLYYAQQYSFTVLHYVVQYGLVVQSSYLAVQFYALTYVIYAVNVVYCSL